ncbi:MAG: flagellar motor protein MotB [Deltaproteobacteria bacterium]|nr:flagellar motor protein MotB [Deltaproteobacteria bacterium]
MAGKKKEEEVPRDPSRVMFLSLNMILLAFFILLVALSAPDKEKEAEIAIELRKAFQSFGGAFISLGKRIEQRGISKQEHALEAAKEVEQFLGELSLFIEENEEAKEVTYEIRAQGMKIHLSERLAFQPGRATLLKGAYPMLDSVRTLIGRITNQVIIEGHTDDTEIRTEKHRNNWELSAARAHEVYKYLTRESDIDRGRFTVLGYGSQRPLASNLSESGRTKNRRVTITLSGALRRAGLGQ